VELRSRWLVCGEKVKKQKRRTFLRKTRLDVIDYCGFGSISAKDFRQTATKGNLLALNPWQTHGLKS
jgi:hypothetical protein